MTQYYDLILCLIPLALAGISGVLIVAGLALTTAIPIAGLVATALIGHAMFVRAPVANPERRSVGTEAPGFGSAD